MDETAVGASHWGEASETGRGRGERRCNALYARAEVELDDERMLSNRGSAAAVRDRAAAAVVDSNDADAADSVNGRLKAIIGSGRGLCDESLEVLRILFALPTSATADSPDASLIWLSVLYQHVIPAFSMIANINLKFADKGSCLRDGITVAQICVAILFPRHWSYCDFPGSHPIPLILSPEIPSEADLDLPSSLIRSFTSFSTPFPTVVAMADEDRRAKRSRFDQTEPEPRRSRFDRRSRSPSARQSESTRTRSPLSREPRSPAGTGSGKGSPADPAAAAGTCYAMGAFFIY